VKCVVAVLIDNQAIGVAHFTGGFVC